MTDRSLILPEIFSLQPQDCELLHGGLRYLEFPLSPELDPGERRYRLQVQPEEGGEPLKEDWETIAAGRRSCYLEPLTERFGWGSVILDAFSGSCWLGALASSQPSTRLALCMDMSTYLLRELAPQLFQRLKGEPSRAMLLRGDVNSPPFKPGTFDRIFVDAGLHHIPDHRLVSVLKNLGSLLTRGGLLMAIREPFLTRVPFLSRRVLRNFGAAERELGACERIRTLDQWRGAAGAAGLRCLFLPQPPEDTAPGLAGFLRKGLGTGPLAPLIREIWPSYSMVMYRKPSFP